MNVVVTGGGTIAPIDDVRHIANLSTGRFAAAITEACLDRGATVWHVHTRSAQRPLIRAAQFALDAADPSAEHDRLEKLRLKWLSVHHRLRLTPLAIGTVGDYAETLRQLLETHPIDVAFLPMAVSDFEPVPRPGKLSSDAESVTIACRRTTKVIRSVRDWSPSIYLVGFKLLSDAAPQELIRIAERSCVVNRADLTVANDLRTLREGRHTVHLVRPGRAVETLGPGDDLARRLVARVLDWAALPSDTALSSLS